MRLKSIKLAGFKSFVDPTTVTFTSNMSAVVGPNGCGKSNIIDAVKWVMGESSAKNLRGESMTDVIFNGSSARKPVGQASIELVFDNSARTLKGEFAGYNEVSVRRKVTRDGDSSYFMNGAKCRRKDITDLFLGTGLGPRSYAIIEQGMISKLIEAKPQELRVFIEEAAGISRYKERRRDTENRIRRSRENLERLTDIREELERQLAHLDRQAKTAMRFQALKQEEREQTLLLWSIQWQDLMSRKQQSDLGVGELQVRLESVLTQKNKVALAMDTLRTEQAELGEAFQQAQSHFYQLGTSIASLEQQIRHAGERASQLQADIVRNQQALEELLSHGESDNSQELELQEELEMLSPELMECEAQMEEWGTDVDRQQQHLREVELSWEHASQVAQEAKAQADMAQNRCQFLDSSVHRLAGQLTEIGDELPDDDTTQIEDIAGLEERLMSLEEQGLELDTTLEQLRCDSDAKAMQIEAFRRERETVVGEYQRCDGKLSALDALMASKHSQGVAVSDWLDTQGLVNADKWFETVDVEPVWQRAFEQVMGPLMAAVVVVPDEFEAKVLAAVDGVAIATKTGSQPSHKTLASKAQGVVPEYIDSIYCADSLSEALRLCSQLQPYESVVTPEGDWLSRQWYVKAAAEGQNSILAAKQQRNNLADELASLQAQREEIEHLLSAEVDALQRQQSQLADVTENQKQLSSQKAQAASQLQRLVMELEHRRALRLQQSSQKQSLEDELAEEQERLVEARMQYDTLQASAEEALVLKLQLDQQRQELREQREQQQQGLTRFREQHRQLQMREQLLRSKLDSAGDTRRRLQEQTQVIESQVSALKHQLATHTDNSPELQIQLEEYLAKKIDAEAAVAELADRQAQLEQQLRELESQRSTCEAEELELRGVIENQKLAAQTVAVELGHVSQKLLQAEQNPEDILEHCDDIPAESDLEARLQKIANTITRLGAINLAAIEEYEQQSERKRYLDEQNDDLVDALETLENAIRRIDKETKSRFKQTFDEVNTGLGELFPQVFGGGQAYLELTDDDLLETGIAIMARPPGKRNSTIHLLSGGEKALTAIALVFAIFKLNPAPFCMLDEVDAPLDDANVGRYARIVKTMSENVQFIYITHNKIPMEYADQLMGVTMQEAGVSRLVSVDINRAAELAAM